MAKLQTYRDPKKHIVTTFEEDLSFCVISLK